jgi:putative ABC transport system substrate-binding protein
MSIRRRRRDFIAGLGGAAAVPLAARAQQPAMPVIGFLGSESAELWASPMRAFHQGLADAGYAEGRNVAIEYRWAEGRNDRLTAMAADLAHRRVTVIAAPGSVAAALAAKAATAMIPIVFDTGADAVVTGLVGSLSRPGGNLTGVSTLGVEIGPKRVEMLHELIPAATSIGVLINPTAPTSAYVTKELQTAVHKLGLQAHVLNASTDSDIDGAIATLVQLRAGALVIGPDSFFTARSEQLAGLALRHAMPAIYESRLFAAAGGLISYGVSPLDLFSQVGVYTGRILKGEKPADLPVQQVTKVELIINLKTAKALGVTVPLMLRGRADEVIE